MQVRLLSTLAIQDRIRADVRVLVAFCRAFHIEFCFLYCCRSFLAICNLPFNLPEHDWETTQHVLVAELPLFPEATLVVVERFLPLARVGALRQVRRLRYHVEERLALVANGWQVLLLFLEAVLVLLPPFAEFDVAEFGHLGQLLLGSLGVFAGARGDDVGRQRGLHQEAFISFSFVHLQYIFVSCGADHAVLALILVLLS